MRLLFNSKGYVINRISPEAEALKSENTSLKRRNSKLERLATVDGLTGLFNRRYFDESTYQTVLSMDRRYLQKPVEKDKRKNQSETDRRKNRSKKSLGILMLDIDNFKKINDTYGHPIGDKILRETAHILVRAKSPIVGRSDLVFRYGGEEIVVLAHMGNRKNLEIYAERIRHRISKHNYGIGKRVTVSIGGALLPQDARNQKDLIKIVDERLYKAKNSGRNKSIVY